MWSWLKKRKAFFAIVVPYIALAIAAVAAIGVYATRADQAEVRAVISAERAARAIEAQQASCLDRRQARADSDEIFLIIAASLPPATGARIETLVRARPAVEC